MSDTNLNSKFIASSKIFATIGKYEPPRNSLLKRGWTENNNKIQVNVPENSLGFIWNPRNCTVRKGVGSTVFVNKIERVQHLDFTSKEGLKTCAEKVKDSNIFIPRNHLITDSDSKQLFLKDVKLTKCISFLRFFSKSIDLCTYFSIDGKVSVKDCVDFAIETVKQNYGVDLEKSPSICKKQLKIIDSIMIHKGKFKLIVANELVEIGKLVDDTLNKVEEFWPQRKYDGVKNLWIIKPIGGSCGHGIFLMNQEEKILKMLMKRNSEKNYVVQKYMELPFLIHKTKFDIRQYFLTFINDKKITVWIYNNCYIKLCRRTYSLANFDESVHITNFPIQKNYKQKNPKLPSDSMWVLKDFKNYLKEIGDENLWDKKIFKRIKDTILAIILNSLEGMSLVNHSFQLYGADFLVGFDGQPILLEVNPKSDLSFTTEAKTEVCTKLMEDVVKVIIDHSQKNAAPTGNFEKIYETEIPIKPV